MRLTQLSQLVNSTRRESTASYCLDSGQRVLCRHGSVARRARRDRRRQRGASVSPRGRGGECGGLARCFARGAPLAHLRPPPRFSPTPVCATSRSLRAGSRCLVDSRATCGYVLAEIRPQRAAVLDRLLGRRTLAAAPVYRHGKRLRSVYRRQQRALLRSVLRS